MIPSVKSNLIDRVVSYFNPVTGAKRLQARANMAVYNSVSGSTGYDTPGSRKRFMRGINVTSNSPDADIISKQSDAVALSRDVAMNNPLAIAALRRIRTNTVGTGLKVKSQIDHEYLGLSPDDAREWERNTEREFNVWANSKDCDITCHQNFYEIQDLVFYSVLLSGDIFVMYPQKDVNKNLYKTKIKLAESDLCSNPNGIPSSNIIGGVECDKDGMPRVYHFCNQYPGDNYLKISLPKWTAVPAFNDSGYKQVFHLFFKERPGQQRGMPMLAGVINLLFAVTKLMESELTAHVISSFFTVFIKSNRGYNNGLSEGFTPEDSLTKNSDGTNKTAAEAFNYEMAPGNILELDDDKEVQIADPRRMNDAFESFYTAFVKQLSAALELPFEQLLLHFQASYSASRGALLEAWKAVRVKRAWLTANFCQPTYEKWLEEAVSIGRINAPGFFEDDSIRYSWCKASWSGMGNGQLDPLKETKAGVLRVNNGFSDYEAEYAAINDNGDWQGSINKLGYQKQIIKKNGLNPTMDDQSSFDEIPGQTQNDKDQKA
jgi:lambda family phage portal protein